MFLTPQTRLLPLLALAVIGAGCAKPLPPMTPVAKARNFGYLDRQVAGDVWEVTYFGPVRYGAGDAVDRAPQVELAVARSRELAMWRAAQIALAQGRNSFTVLNEKVATRVRQYPGYGPTYGPVYPPYYFRPPVLAKRYRYKRRYRHRYRGRYRYRYRYPYRYRYRYRPYWGFWGGYWGPAVYWGYPWPYYRRWPGTRARAWVTLRVRLFRGRGGKIGAAAYQARMVAKYGRQTPPADGASRGESGGESKKAK